MLYLSFRLDPTVVDNALDEWEDVEDQLDLPKEVRIELAHQAWKNGNGKLKIGKLAREFGISYSTLYDRIHGAIPKALASQAMQRLSVPEEKAIRNWLVELANWN
jgi:transposase-like protein